jgi:hypothetical protein
MNGLTSVESLWNGQRALTTRRSEFITGVTPAMGPAERPVATERDTYVEFIRKEVRP